MKEIKEAFGERIKQLRSEREISQEYLANLAEMDRTYITSVENGKRNISIKNIEKICKALNITLRDFFDDEIFL